jgi:hypothetical protein
MTKTTRMTNPDIVDHPAAFQTCGRVVQDAATIRWCHILLDCSMTKKNGVIGLGAMGSAMAEDGQSPI